MEDGASEVEGPALDAAEEQVLPPTAASAAVTSGDILGHMLGVQNPCESVFRSFGMMRQVSHEFMRGVDAKMANKGWLAPFKRRAAEFCDDLQPGVVLSEGTARGAGLRRLLGQGRYGDIANGMREFAEDRDTQLLIIATLLEKLRAGNKFHKHNRILASTTTNFTLHCALARTIRVHFASVNVVRRAIAVMRLLVEKDASNNDLNVSDDVVSYVVWTMLEVMKRFGWHFVQACLVVIRTVTAHCVPQNVQGKVLIEGIANIMQDKLGYTFIVEAGMFLIARCVQKLDMSKEVDRALLLSCDVAKVAHVILNCASEHLQTDPYILRTSLDVLSSLNTATAKVEWFRHVAGQLQRFRPIMQPGRTLELAVTALMAFGKDVEMLQQVVRVALSLIDYYWEPQDPPVEQPDDMSRTLFPGTTFIPIIVLAMRSVPISAVTKSTCASLFLLLHKVCINHAVHTEFAIAHRVLPLLTAQYDFTVLEHNIDTDFIHQRDRLQQLLLPAQAP